MGGVNRDYDNNGPGSFGYSRSGTLNEGQNHHNSYKYDVTRDNRAHICWLKRRDWKFEGIGELSHIEIMPSSYYHRFYILD